MTANADLLVIFGITGDLARVMTFRSLYRLERRNMLNTPVIGVAADDWSVDKLRQHARESIEGTGEPVEDQVFARFAERLSYVSGDFTDPGLYQRLSRQVADATTPLFYLEIPPSLFATVVKRLAQADLVRRGRVVVEKPFGHDLASAKALAAQLHQYLPERQLYRIDHFLGKLGLEELLYLRFANTMLEPVWNRNYVDSVEITLAEQFGVTDRGHFYDPVGALRDVVVNHLMQVLSAGAMEPPAGHDPEVLKDGQLALWRAVNTAESAHYVRGQYHGYREVAGVSPDSTTETYAALRLDIDNWRWSGVPFFLRAGKCLPATQTELRLVFTRPPRLGLQILRDRRPEPDQLVIKIDPATGIRVRWDARHGDAPGPEPITLDMEFADQGGAGPTPYEVLLHAAMAGNSTRFTRQDGVEERWRIVQPLLENPPAVRGYQPGTWGPAEAEALVEGHGGWHGPWVAA